MSEYDVETPTVEVRVYERGTLVERILCESLDDAADIVATWEEREGFTCEVEDLAEHHAPNDVLAPEPEDALTESEYRLEQES
jgi:hypothetical protein